MSRTDKSESLSGSCGKTVSPYSLVLIQKFTPGVIYLPQNYVSIGATISVSLLKVLPFTDRQNVNLSLKMMVVKAQTL